MEYRSSSSYAASRLCYISGRIGGEALVCGDEPDETEREENLCGMVEGSPTSCRRHGALINGSMMCYRRYRNH